MELARILHPDQYLRDSRRFKSTCFTNPSDNSGISVVGVDCVGKRDVKTRICAHVEDHYAIRTTGNPIILWIFTEELILSKSKECNLKSDTSNGDPCHFNICGLSKKQVKDFLSENLKLASVFVCKPNHDLIPATYELLESLIPKDVKRQDR